jgi:MFS family permease
LTDETQGPAPHGELAAPPPPGWRRSFAALRHPNYRLWFAGQLFSLVGTWMQATAQGYLVFELTESSAYLGYVAFAAGVPTWLFMLWAGVIADRMPRRTLLLGTQIPMLLGAALLAWLAFAGVVRPWHIVALAFLLGTATAFDAPARQAFVAELVDHADLGNAVALNALMFNFAVVVGPAVGGVVYAALGPGWCFTANAVSFLAVIGALLAMRLPPLPPARRSSSAFAELRQGLVYVARHRSIRVVILLVGTMTVLGFSYVSLVPAFAVKVLGGDAQLNGLLQSARGLGALGAALYLATLGSRRAPGRLLALGSLVVPVSLFAFSMVRSVPLALGALVVVGVGLIFIFNNANVLLLTLTDPALRGRVLSVYTLTFFGLLPLGSLGMGTAAEHVGEALTVGLGAAALLVVAVGVALRFPILWRGPAADDTAAAARR